MKADDLIAIARRSEITGENAAEELLQIMLRLGLVEEGEKVAESAEEK